MEIHLFRGTGKRVKCYENCSKKRFKNDSGSKKRFKNDSDTDIFCSMYSIPIPKAVGAS